MLVSKIGLKEPVPSPSLLFGENTLIEFGKSEKG
jgi:hypothetical protein